MLTVLVLTLIPILNTSALLDPDEILDFCF